MAIRREELAVPFPGHEARVLDFPSAPLRAQVQAERDRRRARSARRRMIVRRQRAVLVVVGIAIVGVLAGGPQATAPAAPARGEAPRAVVLRSGQTLWDVAERHAPEGVDLRAYVDALIDLNGVDAVVPAGARISLPR